jgi:predicted MFS family arabinose efflux permease
MLVTMSIPLFWMRLRTPPSTKRRDFLDLSAFKAGPYLVFCFGTFFGFMGIYVTFFYIQLYALEQTDMDPNLTSYLLCIINATSTVGRLIPNFFADKVGPLNIQFPFAIIASILCFGWIGIKTSTGLIIFCVLYGFFCGSFVSLPGITVVSLSTNLKTIGIQLGMAMSISGFGLLIGEPVAGAILRSKGGWVGLQIWCGVLLTLSGLFSLAARILKVGPKLDAKA